MVGVEAAGHGIASGAHAAPLCAGTVGVLHGNKTYLLQDRDGQIAHAHSISAGLDYPGVGPEHAWLHAIGRAEYVSITDKEALEAFQLCTKMEGIIPALESSHALAQAARMAPQLPRERILFTVDFIPIETIHWRDMPDSSTGEAGHRSCTSCTSRAPQRRAMRRATQMSIG